ncbi:hypothetical protein PG999_003974 [Apiospora kogelbergensis]|uniref:Uncharacterized protein n=1 Tax=Apiospora kogelbergensis TaxID=1337665 RepID=A0AAW0R579_9PEZI
MPRQPVNQLSADESTEDAGSLFEGAHGLFQKIEDDQSTVPGRNSTEQAPGPRSGPVTSWTAPTIQRWITLPATVWQRSSAVRSKSTAPPPSVATLRRKACLYANSHWQDLAMLRRAFCFVEEIGALGSLHRAPEGRSESWSTRRSESAPAINEINVGDPRSKRSTRTYATETPYIVIVVCHSMRDGVEYTVSAADWWTFDSGSTTLAFTDVK